MSGTSAYLEWLIDECGGFSKFQTLMFLSLIGSRLVPTWSMQMMAFAGATPDWYCVHDINNGTPSIHSSSDASIVQRSSNTSYKLCYPPQNATSHSCSEISYDVSMDTVVSEWSLICDKEWVSATITTIQMTGLLVSGLLSGHLADAIGRKLAYFLSLMLMLIFNVAAGFSSSWQMFATFQFILGLGIGGYLTVYYNYLIEFTPAKHRSLIIAFPAWPIWAAVFGVVSMWLHNWRYLHFATAVCTIPWLLFWWVTPESFRYLVVHNKLEEAGNTIRKIARLNGCSAPDMKPLRFIVKEDNDIHGEKKYSLKDLVMSSYLLKSSALLGICWISCGYGYYAISFGVQSLSGSLYLNMFLLNVVEVPATVSTYYLSNRKRTTVGFFLFAGITGTVVAAVQVTDLEVKGQLINGFALAAKIGVFTAWSALMLLSTESYPTVVRNIGYGLQNSVSGIGAMLAPQIVYLDNRIPGIMYFLFGGLMFLSAVSAALVPETNKKPMADVIRKDKKTSRTAPADQHEGEENNKHADGYSNEAFDTRL